MSWMQSAHRTEPQKRDAVESACNLIDTVYRHVRDLLSTDAKYFTAQEALELTEQEFKSRATRDKDTLAEWRLRRRMFTDTDSPLITEIGALTCGSLRLETAYAPFS